jgi:hypothetical protein
VLCVCGGINLLHAGLTVRLCAAQSNRADPWEKPRLTEPKLVIGITSPKVVQAQKVFNFLKLFRNSRKAEQRGYFF